jgi:receptor protein-tyrosine kinase
MLSAVAGVPILATVPESASRGTHALTFPADGGTAYAESIRKLRTGIEFAGPSADAIRSVLVTSPRYSEPAGCLAADLAIVLSEAGRRVLLVDGDLRSPSLDSYLGMTPAAGFSDVLAGAIPLVDVLVQVPGRSLTLLPAGSIRSGSADAIASTSARQVLVEATEKFEYTIIVGPPLSLYSDSAVIGSVVDGVVLVSTQSISSVDEVEGAVTTLRAAGANLLGAVLAGAGRSGSVKGRSRVIVVDEPSVNEPPVKDTSNEPVGAWPPVERGAAAQLVRTEPDMGSTGKNEVNKHDSADSGESFADDVRIDFDEWEPAETEERYTRSDLDSPTVAIPRSMLRTKVVPKANRSSDELSTDERQG